MNAKIPASAVAGVVAALLVVQLVPYGRDHTNRPVTREPVWDSPETRALAARACFDCHSQETEWPWYASIAPVSWVVQRHVEEGRAHLDLSRWDRPQEEAAEAPETLLEGEMPPRYYTRFHPAARLTDAERVALIEGLRATIAPHLEVGELGPERDDD